MCLKRLEPGELQQVLNIRRGKPVLLDARYLHAEPFRKRYQWFTQPVIRGDQQPRTRSAERLQIPKRLKHIARVADVVKQNVVEILVLPEKLEELFRVGKTNGKIERWISFLSDLNYLGTNIYPLRFTWTYRSQEHPSVTTN